MQKYQKKRICKKMNEKNLFFLHHVKNFLLFLQRKKKYQSLNKFKSYDKS